MHHHFGQLGQILIARNGFSPQESVSTVCNGAQKRRWNRSLNESFAHRTVCFDANARSLPGPNASRNNTYRKQRLVGRIAGESNATAAGV